MNIDLTGDDINILVKSGNNCLNTCQEGGASHRCPDCQRLQQVLSKLQAGMSL